MDSTSPASEKSARIFGIFFMIAFLTYGSGSAIIESIFSTDSPLLYISNHKSQLVLAVVFMALIHSFVNIGVPVIMYPILKPTSPTLMLGYLIAAVTATIVLIIGAVFLLLLLPLSDHFTQTGGLMSPYFEGMTMLFYRGNFYAYQLGMAIWGIGGLMLCNLLSRSNLVPKFFAIWGSLGYLIFFAGTVLELLGQPYGVFLSLPGGLFEIALSLWLIVKGFNQTEV